MVPVTVRPVRDITSEIRYLLSGNPPNQKSLLSTIKSSDNIMRDIGLSEYDGYKKSKSCGLCGGPDRPRRSRPDQRRFRPGLVACTRVYSRTPGVSLSLRHCLSRMRCRLAMAAHRRACRSRAVRISPALAAAIKIALDGHRVRRGYLVVGLFDRRDGGKRLGIVFTAR